MKAAEYLLRHAARERESSEHERGEASALRQAKAASQVSITKNVAAISTEKKCDSRRWITATARKRRRQQPG